ncbi:MAG: hypothetical protein RIE06_15550 [Roseibium album]|uniref:hypothetical protein n=1 Tax=Hyphomicrobiales TaxID=356 RepID=UPI0032EFB0E3
MKPLAFDCGSVEAACREAFEIVMTTRGLETIWNADLEEFGEEPGWSYPLLVDRYQEVAEDRLSNILLQLAVSYRTLDDQLENDTEYGVFKKRQLQVHESFLVVYDGNGTPDTLRECCNKIIHTSDFRPVYDNGSQPRDEGIYYLTGEIELEGTKGKSEWLVSFDYFKFLEAMLEVIEFLERERSESGAEPTILSSRDD